MNPGYILLLTTYGINVGVFYAISTLLNTTIVMHFDYEVNMWNQCRYLIVSFKIYDKLFFLSRTLFKNMNLPFTLQRKACFLKLFLELTNLYCSSLFYGIMISTIWVLKIYTISGLFKQLAEIWKTWLLVCWNLKKIIVPQMCNFLEQKQSKKRNDLRYCF